MMLKNQKQILKTKKDLWFYIYKIITDLNRLFKVIILKGKNSLFCPSKFLLDLFGVTSPFGDIANEL